MHDWQVVLVFNNEYRVENSHVTGDPAVAERTLLKYVKQYGPLGYRCGIFTFSREAVLIEQSKKIPVVIKGMINGDFLPIKETSV